MQSFNCDPSVVDFDQPQMTVVAVHVFLCDWSKVNFQSGPVVRWENRHRLLRLQTCLLVPALPAQSWTHVWQQPVART
jgi:hypothetical protein